MNLDRGLKMKGLVLSCDVLIADADITTEWAVANCQVHTHESCYLQLLHCSTTFQVMFRFFIKVL
jgi:hypothetical protein